MSAARRALHEILLRALRFALPTQGADGAFLIPPAINPYKVYYDQQVMVGLAYAYATRFAGNTHHGKATTMRALAGAVRYMLDAGRLATPAADGGLEHRNLRATLRVVELCGDALPKRLRADLAAAHRACLTALLGRMRRYAKLRVFDARTLTTGTNHAWGYLAVTGLLARHLGEAAVLAELRPFADRFAAAQDATGHWTENSGPTSVYTRVSAHYQGICTEIWDTPALRRASRRAVDFRLRFSFPDGTPIECFDERVQAVEPFYDLSQRMFGLTALPYHPDGRASFADALARMLAGARATATYSSLEFVHFVTDALDRLDRLDGAKPWTPPRTLLARGDGFGTSRRGAWQVAWQAMPTRDWHENPFLLDRQALFSLLHAGGGRLVNGSNSKRQPELATFAASRVDGTFAEREPSLPTGGAWRDGAGGLGTLEVDYPDFTARLIFTPRGAKRISLKITTRPRPRRKLARLVCNVLLPFAWGGKVRPEGGDWLTLGAEAPIAFQGPIEGWLENQRLRFAASRRFYATWPVIPFSSYRTPLHQKAPDGAWFAVTFDLDSAKPDSLELEWRVSADRGRKS